MPGRRYFPFAREISPERFGFEIGPAAVTARRRSPVSERSGRTSASRAGSSGPVAFNEISAGSERPTQPDTAREVPGPSRSKGSSVTRSRASVASTGPFVENAPGRFGTSRVARETRISPVADSPARAGRTIVPEAAREPPYPSGSSADVKRSSRARLGASSATSSGAPSRNGSPEAVSRNPPGAETSPSRCPPSTFAESVGGPSAGRACPKKRPSASEARTVRSGRSSGPDPETSKESFPSRSRRCSASLSIAASAMPSPDAWASNRFSRSAIEPRPATVPPPAGAFTSSSAKRPGVRTARPAIRSKGWPQTTRAFELRRASAGEFLLRALQREAPGELPGDREVEIEVVEQARDRIATRRDDEVEEGRARPFPIRRPPFERQGRFPFRDVQRPEEEGAARHVHGPPRAPERDAGELRLFCRDAGRRLRIRPGSGEMPLHFPASAEAERLGLAAARGQEVLEDPIRFGEIARAQAKIEVGLPGADRDRPRELDARTREAELAALEPDGSAPDRERPAPFCRDAVAAAHLRDRRQGSDPEPPSPVRALDPFGPPVEGSLEPRRAGEPGSGETQVGEEALEGDPISLDREGHRRLGSDEIRDRERPLRLTPRVAGALDLRDEGSRGRRDVREHVLQDERGAPGARRRERARDSKSARRREVDPGADRGPPFEPEFRVEDPLDLLDREVARNEEGRARGVRLEGPRRRQPAEGALQAQVVHRQAAPGVEPEAQLDGAHDRLLSRQLEGAPSREKRAAIFVRARRDELRGETVEPAVEPDPLPLELEEAFLHEERADANFDAARPRRTRQTGREVPAPVGHLLEEDPRAQRAQAPEAELPSRERSAAADRDFLGGQKRPVLRDLELGIVPDAHVNEGDRRRKQAHLHRVEVHRHAEGLGEARLRDAVHEILEALRPPDRPSREREEEDEDCEETRRREAPQEGERLGWRRCGFGRLWIGQAGTAPSGSSDPPVQLLGKLVEVVRLRRAEEPHRRPARADFDPAFRAAPESPPARRASGEAPRAGRGRARPGRSGPTRGRRAVAGRGNAGRSA